MKYILIALLFLGLGAKAQSDSLIQINKEDGNVVYWDSSGKLMITEAVAYDSILIDQFGREKEGNHVRIILPSGNIIRTDRFFLFIPRRLRQPF